MDWQDDAIVLAVRPLGEGGAVVELLTRAHGRHAGLVRGARSKNNRGVAQPGNRVSAAWRARLADQLGQLSLELTTAHAARAMEDPGRLAALSAACALCHAVLPDRQPHGAAFEALDALLGALAGDSWPSVYVHFELALLRDLGFGLDLSACAATGDTRDLAYVSPKTGRAVSAAVGAAYRDKLLALPAFLTQGGEGDAAQIRDGLALTGFFLERHVRPHLPPARDRLAGRFGG